MEHNQNRFPLAPQGQGQPQVPLPQGVANERPRTEYNVLQELLMNIQERLDISERTNLERLEANREAMVGRMDEMLRSNEQSILNRVGAALNEQTAQTISVAQQVENVQRDQQQQTAVMQALQASQLNSAHPVSVGGAGGFVGAPEAASAVFNRPFHRTPEMEAAPPKEGTVGFGAHASGMVAHMPTRNFDSMLRRWHQYKRMMPFSDYMSSVYRVLRSCGVDVDFPGNFEVLKDELWGKIDIEVKAPMSAMMPVNYAHLTFRDYVNVLSAQFDPPSMSMELLQAYKKRRQGANEDVRSYLNAKWDLYKRSHPKWATSGFESVREEILEGLVNPTVFEKSIEVITVNFDQLVSSVVNITTAEQTKHRLGRGSGTTDGLTVAQGYLVNHKKGVTQDVNQVFEDVGVDENHTVNQVTSNFGANRSRPQARNSNQNRSNKGAANSGAPPAGRRRRKQFCFNCNSDSHLCNSPKCSEPGSLRYLPSNMEYMRARYAKPTVKNSVGQIAVAESEIPVENETTFLGVARGSQPQK